MKKCIIFLLFSLYILHSTFYIPQALAQTCQTNSLITNGLISTPNLDALNQAGTAIGNCVAGNATTPLPQAAIAPYRLPTYADLKSLYYTQAKPPYQAPAITITGWPLNQTPADLNSTAIPGYLSNNDSTILVNGNLAINTPISSIATKTGVIFIEGSLSINTNVLYGTPGSGGLVFVVAGDINIDTKVTEVDAVLASGGTICTASQNGSCAFSGFAAPISNTPLTIKGSLIALPSTNTSLTNQIKFKKSLFVNTISAEKIIDQPKYLVILKNLFTQTLKIQTDVNSGWNPTSCTSFCPISSTVACGQSSTDGCGNTCPGTGTACSTGNSCVNGSCVPVPTLSISPAAVPLYTTRPNPYNVSISWSNITPVPAQDYLALYSGGAPKNSSYISQLRLDSSQCSISGSSGSCSYAVPNPSPNSNYLPTGFYEIRYIQNGNYSTPYSTATFTVDSTSGSACVSGNCTSVPTISVSPNPVPLYTTRPNPYTVSVSWSNITSPSSSDDIALYSLGAPGGTSYISDTKGSNNPCTGASQGSCSFDIYGSLPTGNYEIRYIQNGNYSTPLASTTFSIDNSH